MIFEVKIRPEAENDIEDAAFWYESQIDGLGHDFVSIISEAFEKLSRQPLAYPVVYRETRRILINRFPFGVYFKIDNDKVIVIAVMHSSRDPRRWKERKAEK